MNVFVRVTLEYRRILKQKRALKKRVQLPQDWFGTSIWSSFHGEGLQFLFVEEEKVTCLTGKERGGHEMKKFPNPSPLTPPPAIKKRNRNKKERALPCLSGVRWIRAHVVVGRTASKEWDSGFGLVTGRVSDGAIFVWPWKMVSVSVRYLFISQWMKRSKHDLFVFPPKKTLIWRRHCSIGQSCCSMTSKRSIDWFLESSRAWSFFTRAFA